MAPIPDTIDYSESTHNTAIRFILDLLSIKVAQGALLAQAFKTAKVTLIPDTIGYSKSTSIVRFITKHIMSDIFYVQLIRNWPEDLVSERYKLLLQITDPVS